MCPDTRLPSSNLVEEKTGARNACVKAGWQGVCKGKGETLAIWRNVEGAWTQLIVHVAARFAGLIFTTKVRNCFRGGGKGFIPPPRTLPA